MNNKDTHINQDHPGKDNFLRKIDIPFEQSKEEIWDTLSDKLTEPARIKPETKIISMTWFKVAAAAVVIILVGTTFFLRSYTNTIYCPKGEHISHVLPDGSTVEMNAESSVSYHSYWWYFRRKVIFEGEAFFKVEKGKSFKVLSGNGNTEVLGTSFNIYTRNNDYKVFCNTGKVKVSSTRSNVELIIHPGELAVLDNVNKVGKVENVKAEKIIGWKNNKFNFASESLKKVFDELERQYNVTIHTELTDPSEFIYTGYFTKTKDVDSTLDLICQSFGLTFVKPGKAEYKVLRNK